MIKVYISGNRADVIEREPLTSGTVGKVINFAFTEDWRLLIKYAVFEGSGRRIALTNIGDSCIIPHEVLAKHGGALRVGVYGRTADGSAATPTVYAQLGIIQRGADPNADPSTKPTLPVWAQIQAQIGDLSNLTTDDKTSLVAAINEAAKSGGGGGQTETEVQLTAAVSAGTSVTIDSRAAEQTVNLAWNVPDAKTIPAFTNYYIAISNIAYPRAFDTKSYTQTWSNNSYHGNGDAFVSGHKYFCAMEYAMDGDSTAKLLGWGETITPSGTDVISGSGWIYGVVKPTNERATHFAFSKTSSGTGTIKHLYCIDVTALFDAGTISSVDINYLAALFGGLDLVPGQDFAGQITIGTATPVGSSCGSPCTIRCFR